MYNCLYVLFYRGPLGRLANLAKSETLLKYCIKKKKKKKKKISNLPRNYVFAFSRKLFIENLK